MVANKKSELKMCDKVATGFYQNSIEVLYCVASIHFNSLIVTYCAFFALFAF